MNKLIAYGISFVVGGAFGALISRFVTRNKMLGDCQKKLDTMHEYYEEVCGHLDIPGELLEAEESKETKSSEVINATRSQDPIVRAVPVEEYVDYTQYYADPVETEHPEDDKPDNEEEKALESQGEWLTREVKEERSKNRAREPKIIKAEECGSDPAYKPIYLTYCTEDGVLVEDQGDVFYESDDVDAISDLIGDALDKYGFRRNDESVIYVRNFAYGIDYEISKFDGSYKDLVGEGV